MTAPAGRPRWRKKRWAAAGLLWLAMPVAYVAGYRAAMRPRTVVWTSWPAKVVVDATYPHPALGWLFAPAERVDRYLRPALWRLTPVPLPPAATPPVAPVPFPGPRYDPIEPAVYREFGPPPPPPHFVI